MSPEIPRGTADERTVIHGRYRLDRALGKGGMGEVWEGHDPVLDRRVAVKLIRFPDGLPDLELERRFAREAQVMARLDHPGAPAIHDAGVFDDGRRLFIVMEYVDGVRLDHVIDMHDPLPIGWVAAVGAQIAAVLAAAHERSILHRDLKPANLILCRDGSVKVLDFGLALLHDPEVTKLTRTGQILGTAHYMPPEQIRAGTLAPQSDLYALGCVLYEMLTGRKPFTGPTEYSVFEQQIQTAPDSIGHSRPDTPPELEDLINALLAKRIEDRPADAGTVHDLLLPYVSGANRLPDAAEPGPSPLRMYANVLSRILNPPGGTTVPVPPLVRPRDAGDFSRGDIGRARREAMSLVRDSRYDRAAEVLAAVEGPASRVLGEDDPDVLSLRAQLANVLFEGADHRRAAPAFHRLAIDLARVHGTDDERVFQCRMQEATCHAYLGDGRLALRLLRDLLSDELSVYPADDPRTLELRRQIGELETSVGDGEAARRTLTDLHDDLSRLYGPDHPAATRIRDGLARPEP